MITQKELTILSEKLACKMKDLLDYFGIRYVESYDRLTTSCPIHEGADNPEAFTITTKRGSFFGCWRCWTHSCEKKYVHSPIGLIRGILSAQKEDDVSFQDAVEFAIEFVNTSSQELKTEGSKLSKDHFEKIYRDVYEERPRPTSGIPRQKVKEMLQRPAIYYVNRGYKTETLEKFDVGVCTDTTKQMKHRVVAPVYDDDYQFMVGCVGRSQEENCNGRKWINSKSFNSGMWLYGYWLAKDKIRETRSVILVEGQGDVWRLHEAGLTNSVGMFGSSLSDAQARILETSGALNVVILSDNDSAGQKAKESITKKCERLFHIVYPEISTKDVGEMTIQQIHSELVPQLEGLV